MRTLLAAFSLSLLAAVAPASLPAANLSAKSRVTRVTAFADGAEVTRTASLTVPAGDVRVAFEGLPDGTDEGSFTVKGRGVKATYGEIEVRSVRGAAPVIDTSADDAELARIDAETQRMAAEDGADASLRMYLDALRDATPRNAEQPPSAQAASGMLDFLQSGYARLVDRALVRGARRSELDARRAIIVKHRAEAAPPPSVASVTATVELDVAEAGELRLDLTYVVDDVSWGPAYRATLDADQKTVTLATEAFLTQQTGEDWTDVALTLSSARPADGVEPQRLTSWMLTPIPNVADVRGSGNNPVDGGLRLEVPTAAIQSFKLITSAASAKYGEQSTGVADLVGSHAALRTDLLVDFDVPGHVSVPSDSAEHRLSLRSDVIPVELEYHVVPEMEEAAYAMARGRAPKDAPLLAGTLRLVAGGALIGEAEMGDVAPGTELVLPFGADPSIRIAHVALPDERDSGTRDETMTRAWTTTIENGRATPVRAIVEGRVPIAAGDDVVVRVTDGTTKGWRDADGRPGILEWPIDVAARGKATVALTYSVKHPKDVRLAGL